jgi:hypothetical protein
MSITIVHHVREKSQSKSSARTLLLDLAIYANDCCGVAWPADATLYHDVHVSRQRIHELKNTLERMGELVIVERPGATNLYFIAWQGKPLGGTSRDTGRHDLHCPLRNPQLAASCARVGMNHFPAPDPQEGSEFSDPPQDHALDTHRGVSDPSDPQGSDFSDEGSQIFLTRKTTENNHKITGAPAIVIAPQRQIRPPDITPKAEQASPFWCPACGVAIPTCRHRVVYGSTRGKPHLGT